MNFILAGRFEKNMGLRRAGIGKIWDFPAGREPPAPAGTAGDSRMYRIIVTAFPLLSDS